MFIRVDQAVGALLALMVLLLLGYLIAIKIFVLIWYFMHFGFYLIPIIIMIYIVFYSLGFVLKFEILYGIGKIFLFLGFIYIFVLSVSLWFNYAFDIFKGFSNTLYYPLKLIGMGGITIPSEVFSMKIFTYNVPFDSSFMKAFFCIANFAIYIIAIVGVTLNSALGGFFAFIFCIINFILHLYANFPGFAMWIYSFMPWV